MAMKNDTKIEEKLTCCFKIDMRNFTKFDLSTWKSKKFVLIGSLWSRYILFELQKYSGVIFHDTEELCKTWRKADFGLKKDLRNLVNFYKSTWECQNWDFDGILCSKVEKVWPQNLQRSYVSWQWKMMQKFKRNWLVVLNWHEELRKFWSEHSKV